MKYFTKLSICLFLGVNQVMAASIPWKQHDYHDLQSNFGPDKIQRDYAADTSIQPSDLYQMMDPEHTALAFALSFLTSSDFVIHSSYKSDLSGVTHIHLRQTVNGLQVLNGNININILPNGQVVSYGNSFVKPQVKSRKHHPALSLVQKLRNGLTQVVFGQNKYKNDDNFCHMEMEEDYEFVKGKTVISATEAVVALFDFVQPKLRGGSSTINTKLTPKDLVLVQTHDGGDDDGHEFIFMDGVPGALRPVHARHSYVQQNDGALVLVWDIEMELKNNWYSGQVHAFDGTTVGLVDWVHEFQRRPIASTTKNTYHFYYNVIPFGANDPSDTEQQLIKNPYDTFASPEGWHYQGTLSKTKKNKDSDGDGGRITFNVTVGNNVYAHTNPDGGYRWEHNYRPQGLIDGDALVFDYKAKFDVDEPQVYQDAAVTNLFYWCNMAHDFFYRYGFDEKAGNFQQDNLGRGRGQSNNMKQQQQQQHLGDGEGDALIANAQDGSGRNNANFATPPDGQHGKMRMFVWDETRPMRDGDFESGIVIHEYTHGVSTRLTGGPMNSNCLGWGEAGGMGEGWGDFVATILRMKPEYKRDIDFGMGDWANGGEGIRNYKYSTNMAINPSTYKIMDQFDYWGVHAKGEVWAEMLYEMYWNLVDKLGFTSDWFPPTPSNYYHGAGGDGNTLPVMSADDLVAIKDHIVSYGNTLALQLVMDAMKLQPCYPSFMNGRDAILDADKILTGGDSYCTIYAAFAKRGLGPKATLDNGGWLDRREEDYDVPDRCK